jgi:hypothetical protein
MEMVTVEAKVKASVALISYYIEDDRYVEVHLQQDEKNIFLYGPYFFL